MVMVVAAMIAARSSTAAAARAAAAADGRSRVESCARPASLPEPISSRNRSRDGLRGGRERLIARADLAGGSLPLIDAGVLALTPTHGVGVVAGVARDVIIIESVPPCVTSRGPPAIAMTA
jgi:hypothetical protein